MVIALRLKEATEKEYSIAKLRYVLKSLRSLYSLHQSSRKWDYRA